MIQPDLAVIFTTWVLLVVATRIWLSWRQQRHVVAHSHTVPTAFAGRIEITAHQKAAQYTLDRQRLTRLELLLEGAMLLLLTVGGGMTTVGAAMTNLVPAGVWRELATVSAVLLLLAVVDLPFGYWRTFGIEQKHGFNKSSPRLWVLDHLKGLLLFVAIGLPLMALALFLMAKTGSTWWIATWLVWLVVNLLAVWLYPTLIAPLFNKFVPLADPTLRTRIDALLARCGFGAAGLFVMDGSQRSSHGNAYFTGIGKSRRIVFFDTLLNTLAPEQIEAVLAHELGHYANRHLIKRLALLAAVSFLALWAFAAGLDDSRWVTALGLAPLGPAMQLLALMLILPVALFPLSPLASWYSRRHEFEADAYAVRYASAADLRDALVRLYRDNASTLTPDPLHSLFYDSHPPAATRVARLALPVAAA